MRESVWSLSYLVTDSALVLSSLIKSWRTKIRGSHWLRRPRTFRRANGGRLSEKGMRIGFNRRGRRHGKSYANKKPSGYHISFQTLYQFAVNAKKSLEKIILETLEMNLECFVTAVLIK